MVMSRSPVPNPNGNKVQSSVSRTASVNLK